MPPRIHHCSDPNCDGPGIPHGCQGPAGDESFIKCGRCEAQGPTEKSMVKAIYGWNDRKLKDPCNYGKN